MPITAVAQPGNTPPRIQVNITGLTDATTTIVRNDPDGRSRPVRSAEPLTLTSGAGVALDYEAPPGSPVTYTSIPPTNTTETSTAVTLVTTDAWLIHPGVPALSVRVDQLHLQALDDRARAARSGVLQPLGRATPVVVTETRGSVTAGVTVITDTLTDRDAMWTLLGTGVTLLLHIPATYAYGVTWEYIAVGDVTEAYLARGLSAARTFTLPYTVVDRPVGALVAQWTYAGALAARATYTDIRTAYPTYTDLLANTPTT